MCQELIKEIDKFKKPKKVEWELHDGDIVINASKWREIKKRYQKVDVAPCTHLPPGQHPYPTMRFLERKEGI